MVIYRRTTTYNNSHKNAKKLLGLVNQLLDFRKLEMKELRLQLSVGDIIGFLREVTLSFRDLAEKKNITFTFLSAIEFIEMLFDADKIERIMFNLLSNTFKFTRDDGKISVHVSIPRNNYENRMLEIKI